MCKQALKINKRASNLGSLAELGRLPLSITIIISSIKYFYRLLAAEPNSLLNCALRSQMSLNKNSGNTLTYPQVITNLLSELKFEHSITTFKELNLESSKNQIKTLGKSLLDKCTSHFKSRAMTKIKDYGNSDSKLAIYAKVKGEYAYETYLNTAGTFSSAITKFRLSAHNLPIERGRYMRPKLERKDRICKFCKIDMGDEIHALLMCNNTILSDLRNTFLPKISAEIPELNLLGDQERLFAILSGKNDLALPFVSQWLSRCDLVHKKHL